MASASTPSNPLLIAELADHLMGYLGFDDLAACFEVCELWRQLVPAHGAKVAAARASITIMNDMTDKEGNAYLFAVGRHPCFRGNKFCFRNADLSCPAVQQLLELNGPEIKELELCYGQDATDRAVASTALAELVTFKTPNLQTLVISELPLHITQGDVFRDPEVIYYTFSLKKIEIHIDFVGRQSQSTGDTGRNPTPPLSLPSNEDAPDPRPVPPTGYSVEFLTGLFDLCPQLEHLVIKDRRDSDGAISSAEHGKVFQALGRMPFPFPAMNMKNFRFQKDD